MVTVNNRVAVEPVASSSTKVETSRGVALISQYVTLTELRVVFTYQEAGCVVYRPGDTVMIHGQSVKEQWVREVYSSADGTKFILVPRDRIIGYRECSECPST